MLNKTSLIAFILLVAFYAHGQTTTLDSWSFTSATPQKSDLQNKTMGNWDPAKAGTSVPSEGRLRDATAGNSSGAWYGDNLKLAESFDRLTLTVDVADIKHADRDYWFEFLGDLGGNNMRGEINAFSGKISFDVEGGGTTFKSTGANRPVFDVSDYTGAIAMKVVFTWDFANNTLSYTLNGKGEGYTGKGNAAFSVTKTVAADLSGITNIKSMRVRGNKVGSGEYIDLNSVTIATTVDP